LIHLSQRAEQSRVAVLADGADGLADLVSAVSPNTCRSILDWFHISMRLRPIEQMVPKIASACGCSAFDDIC
jgi:hypothetical protein